MGIELGQDSMLVVPIPFFPIFHKLHNPRILPDNRRLNHHPAEQPRVKHPQPAVQTELLPTIAAPQHNIGDTYRQQCGIFAEGVLDPGHADGLYGHDQYYARHSQVY